jgi:perosamine synthetase
MKIAAPPAVARQVPFFRVNITDAEVSEVISTLRSGWLTTGPKVRQFESQFAALVHAQHAVSVNSCTAALHLAVEALGLREGQGVLVPTMTFAATAEVVRYQQAIPILVDCDPVTGNMDLEDAARKLAQFERSATGTSRVVGVMPVHVGGLMMDVGAVRRFADAHGLWIVEDAAHAFPAAWRENADARWQQCGEDTATVTCFSFYANKTITTGEGGMAVTADAAIAARMRVMSLHGLSHDAWNRYSGGGQWDYRIIAPGYKYNLTDIAAAIGIHQLKRAEEMRLQRAVIASRYRKAFSAVPGLELPPDPDDRIHAWHLFPIRLQIERWGIRRDTFVRMMRDRGIVCSVHWRPLHLHPLYEQPVDQTPDGCPQATRFFERNVSLPMFPAMTDAELDYVIEECSEIARRWAR